MSVFLITYDLNKELNRPNMAKKIRETFASWAKLSESSYAVESAASPEHVYSQLSTLLDKNDQIYIISLRKPWTGFGSKEVNDWLDQHLPW